MKLSITKLQIKTIQLKEKSFIEDVIIGDYVKLKNRRGSCWNNQGEMDKYMRQIVHISHRFGSFSFRIHNAARTFILDDIERFATPDEIIHYNNLRGLE